jgi:hypothetical protein
MVIWEACRAGACLCPKGRDPGGLGDVVVSHQAGARPLRSGDPFGVWLQSSHVELGPSRACGEGA